jgi:hypothetical protein
MWRLLFNSVALQSAAITPLLQLHHDAFSLTLLLLNHPLQQPAPSSQVFAAALANRRAGCGSRSSTAASTAADEAHNSAPQDTSASSDLTLSEKQRIQKLKTKQPNPPDVVLSSASIPPSVIQSLRVHAVQNANLPSKGGFLQVEDEILMAAMQVCHPNNCKIVRSRADATEAEHRTA